MSSPKNQKAFLMFSIKISDSLKQAGGWTASKFYCGNQFNFHHWLLSILQQFQ